MTTTTRCRRDEPSTTALVSLDASRATFRISGHLYEKQRAFVVIEDL